MTSIASQKERIQLQIRFIMPQGSTDFLLTRTTACLIWTLQVMRSDYLKVSGKQRQYSLHSFWFFSTIKVKTDLFVDFRITGFCLCSDVIETRMACHMQCLDSLYHFVCFLDIEKGRQNRQKNAALVHENAKQNDNYNEQWNCWQVKWLFTQDVTSYCDPCRAGAMRSNYPMRQVNTIQQSSPCFSRYRCVLKQQSYSNIRLLFRYRRYSEYSRCSVVAVILQCCIYHGSCS